MLRNYCLSKILVFFCILSMAVIVTGCRRSINNPDNIDCHTFDIRNDVSSLKENNIVFRENGSEVTVNKEMMVEFKDNVNAGTEAHIDIGVCSYEGDWIIYCIHFDGSVFRIVEDSSREKHRNTDVAEYLYTRCEGSSREGITYLTFTGSEYYDDLLLYY